MENKVYNTIRKYNLIEEDDNIVLGLSGGPDSMALLYSLIAIKKNLEFNLLIAHVNHGVRGEDAIKDEKFVRGISDNLDLPYFSTRVNMIQTAKDEGISQEEAGRKLRYGFFRDIIKTVGNGKIAVAHNKNDQAETLIMRIMRGTGIDGLKGMDYKSGDIIRPILNIYRTEIEEYISENKIQTVLDKTNLESIYTRNKVRLELIPYIEENFNPNIIDTLFRLSENATVDSELLDNITDKKYDLLLKKKDDTSIILNHNFYINQYEGVKARVIRRAILELNDKLQGIEEIHIFTIMELFNKNETGKSINLPFNMIAKVSYNDLIIEKKIESFIKETSNNEKYDLKLGKNYLKEFDLEINLEVFNLEDIDFKNKPKNIQYFDYDKIKGDVSIRRRSSGDRFNPFGMTGSKKLKDYFIDEKVPRDLRDTIPLIMDNENIVWVIGYRTSEIYKVENNTEKILKVTTKNTASQED